MTSVLRQSTAAQSRSLGPFVDPADGAPETALTIANTDIKLLKNGAAGVDKNAGGGTHRANGSYSVTFDATDTDTVGELEVTVVVAGALVVKKTFWVLEEAVYDAVYAAGAPGYVSTQVVASVTGAVGSVTGSVGSVASYGTLVADIAVAVWGAGTRTLTAFSTALAVSVWDVLATAVATASSIGLQIKTNLDAAVSTRSTYAGGPVDAVTGAVGSVAAGGITAASFAADAITAATVAADVHAEAADAVWDEPLAGHAGIGSTGEALSAAGGAGTPPTAAQVADAVWDEAIGAHAGAGSTGEALSAAGAAGDPWIAPLPGAYAAGSAGAIIGGFVNPPGVKKNAALPHFTFSMLSTVGGELAGLTVTAQRKLDAGAFAACVNAVTEIGDGLYVLSLAAADLNGDVVTLKFTAPGARPRILTILTEP